MTRCVLILLFLVSSCSQPETLPDMDDATSIDLDSLADATIKQVHKEKKQKVLLEQDLWRKK